MEKLISNGFEYYKDCKDCWDPIEAASIVCGVDPDTLDYYKIPQEIRKIFEKSISDYAAGNMTFYIEREIYERSEKDKFLACCSSFCREDDAYNNIYVACFNPCVYVEWTINTKLIKIDSHLRVGRDAEAEYGPYWIHKGHWNPEGPNSIEIKNDVREKEAIYKEIKRLDLWTLYEAIASLTGLFFLDGIDYDASSQFVFSMELSQQIDHRLLTRAVEAGTLQVIGLNKEIEFGFNDDFLNLKVSPFKFLEFVKEKEWF